MWDVSVCVACLATDVRMYSMNANSLLQPYQLLAGVQSGDGMPQKLCWECAALVNKFNLFRHKCERAYLLLQDIYNQHDEINENYAEEIDRKRHNLSSPYAIVNVFSCTVSSNTKDKESTKVYKYEPTQKITEENTAFKFENVTIDAGLDSLIKLEVDAMKIDIDFKDDLINNDDSIDGTMGFAEMENADIAGEKSEDLGYTVEDACPKNGNETRYRMNRKHLYSCTKCAHSTYNKTIARAHQRSHTHKKLKRCEDIGCTVVSVSQEQMAEYVRARQHCDKYKKAQFKCTLCYIAFKNNYELNKHRRHHDSSEGRYECDVCGCRYRTRARIAVHISRYHNKTYACDACEHVSYDLMKAVRHYRQHKIVACNICEISFTSKVLYHRHCRAEHRQRKDDQFACGECGKNCRTGGGLAVHRKRAHTTEMYKYKCDACASPLRDKRAVRAHYRELHPDLVVEAPRTFICEACGMTFKSAADLKKHDLVHNGVREYECKLCPKSFMRRLAFQNHVRTHSDARPYVCHVCGKGFKTQGVLREHASSIHNATHDRACKLCPKRFSSAKNLWMHIKNCHNTVRPYLCDICSKGFNFMSELKKHMKKKTVHKAGRLATYHCAQCNVEFISQSECIAHRQRTHQAARLVTTPLHDAQQSLEIQGKGFQYIAVPKSEHTISRMYKCKICMRSFSKYSLLYLHNKVHSDERPFACDACGKAFKFKAAVKRHMTVHTGEKPYKCEMCEKAFTTNNWRQQHVRRAHLNEHVPYRPRVRSKRRPVQ